MGNDEKSKLTLIKDIESTNYFSVIFYFLNVGLFLAPFVSYKMTDSNTTLAMNGLALMFASQFLKGGFVLALNTFGLATILFMELKKFELIFYKIIPFFNIGIIFTMTNLPNAIRGVGAWLIILINLLVLTYEYYPLLRQLYNKFFSSKNKE